MLNVTEAKVVKSSAGRNKGLICKKEIRINIFWQKMTILI